MTKAEIERLRKRLEEIGDSRWIPTWLKAVGSEEDIADYHSINSAYHGFARLERMDQFIHAMREKHPDMDLAFEEELQKRVDELRKDKELARREGVPVEE